MDNRYKTRFQFLVRFAYAGSKFFGVQEMPGFTTVLGALRARIEESAQQRARGLAVSARTDRGVHALENFATFYMRDIIDIEALLRDIESHRPDGLLTVSGCEISPKIHARANSRGKIYRYTIMDNCDDRELAVDNPYIWKIAAKLDVDKMREVSEAFLGELDFSSLRGGGCQAGSAIKTIFYIRIIRTYFGFITIDIYGNAFLRRMNRNLVGLLAEAGSGLRTKNDIAKIMAARSRDHNGIMAPPHGLCLMRVDLQMLSW